MNVLLTAKCIRSFIALWAVLVLIIGSYAFAHDSSPSGLTPKAFLFYIARLPINTTVCFSNWQEDITYKQEVQHVKDAVGKWAEVSGLRLQWKNQCAKPTKQVVDGKTVDKYQEIIRIRLTNNTPRITPWPAAPVPIPGNGCVNPDTKLQYTDEVEMEVSLDPNTNKPWADGLHHCKGYMWSGGAAQLVPPGSCEYTTHLAFFQHENNYQHEFGHAMGFVHEHGHPAVNPKCRIDEGYTDQNILKVLANHDPLSVMNYVHTIWNDTTKRWEPNPDCPEELGNNWGTNTTGLSHGDYLAARVLYPTDNWASVFGSTLTWVGNPVFLKTGWEEMGVNVTDNPLSSMVSDFQWLVDGIVVGSSRYVTLFNLSTGKHTLDFSFNDRFKQSDRSHFASTYPIEVLPTKQDYLNRAASKEAGFALLWM